MNEAFTGRKLQGRAQRGELGEARRKRLRLGDGRRLMFPPRVVPGRGHGTEGSTRTAITYRSGCFYDLDV